MSVTMEHRSSSNGGMEQSGNTWTSANEQNTSDTTSLSILLAPQPHKTFYSPPNHPGLLDCLVSAELFSMVLFSYELFLHCLSISSKRGCVLYKRKGHSVVLLFHKNERCMVTYCMSGSEHNRDQCVTKLQYLNLVYNTWKPNTFWSE